MNFTTESAVRIFKDANAPELDRLAAFDYLHPVVKSGDAAEAPRLASARQAPTTAPAPAPMQAAPPPAPVPIAPPPTPVQAAAPALAPMPAARADATESLELLKQENEQLKAALAQVQQAAAPVAAAPAPVEKMSALNIIYVYGAATRRVAEDNGETVFRLAARLDAERFDTRQAAEEAAAPLRAMAQVEISPLTRGEIAQAYAGPRRVKPRGHLSDDAVPVLPPLSRPEPPAPVITGEKFILMVDHAPVAFFSTLHEFRAEIAPFNRAQPIPNQVDALRSCLSQLESNRLIEDAKPRLMTAAEAAANEFKPRQVNALSGAHLHRAFQVICLFKGEPVFFCGSLFEFRFEKSSRVEASRFPSIMATTNNIEVARLKRDGPVQFSELTPEELAIPPKARPAQRLDGSSKPFVGEIAVGLKRQPRRSDAFSHA